MASASVSGADERQLQDDLGGERFVFRFRFGCGGPSDQGPRRWTYDEEREVLRARFSPALDLTEAGQDEREDEASVLAFSVERPWLLRSACPAGATELQGEPSDGRVRLVQWFTGEESRATRLPDVFQLTERTAPENAPREGLELALSGTLEAGADGRVIACALPPGGGRPDCTISVSIETAVLQDPVSGAELARWGDP